jgi:hypothetical protein
VYLCLDKHACRRRLAEARIEQPGFALAGDLAGARRIAGELGFPVVLKGCASANQRLVTLVRGEAELVPAVARLQGGLERSHDIARLEGFARAAGIELSAAPRREFLVEAFASGDPLESDGLLVGAEARSFGVCEQITSRPQLLHRGLPHARRPLVRGVRAWSSRAARSDRGPGGHRILARVPLERARVVPDRDRARLGCDEGFGDLFEAVIGAQPTSWRSCWRWAPSRLRAPARARGAPPELLPARTRALRSGTERLAPRTLGMRARRERARGRAHA